MAESVEWLYGQAEYYRKQPNIAHEFIERANQIEKGQNMKSADEKIKKLLLKKDQTVADAMSRR